MRKAFLPIILGLMALIVTACKQPEKKLSFVTSSPAIADHIVEHFYSDDEFGNDDIQVIINNTRNTATIYLNGEVFQLKKSNDLPNYTAENAEYRYSESKGEITFLRKDFDMVLFHHKPESKGKMASY